MLKKLLISNRGEIACRIIRTARQMNIPTVAVYSEIDQGCLHVKLADEAVCIGPAPASESYLNIEAILAAARQTQADAIHPGYGFLSENAKFAQAVYDAGLIFVGPPAQAIEKMGSKAQAKNLMAKAKVPLIPGYHDKDQSLETLTKHAKKIGFPLLIKASHGGGGKGMRIVDKLEHFADKLSACKREAEKSFHSSEVILEKYLTSPRHVEVQVFIDSHGDGVYLFERDCSIQRRHQKVIEEAPAFNLPETIRQKMGETAVRAAQSIEYVGAGTFEFLYADEEFYFMEMNTRLQVEHPVTEAITGEDLVSWQLKIAAGESIPKQQQQLTIHGHAMELRIYAEDPQQDFLPATGTINHFITPKNARVDHGIQVDDRINIHYDPLLAKLIVHGEDRDHCIANAKTALSNLHISGLATNTNFLQSILEQPEFQQLVIDTHFIENHQDSLAQQLSKYTHPAIAIASLFYLNEIAEHGHQVSADRNSPWLESSGWRLNAPTYQRLTWSCRQLNYPIEYKQDENDWQFIIADHSYRCLIQSMTATQCDIAWENQFLSAYCLRLANGFYVAIEGYHYQIILDDPLSKSQQEHHAGELTAPMPGIIRKVLVQTGAHVPPDTPLLILEAMKMEHTITAPTAGIVTELHFQEGDTVDEGAMLLGLQSEED